ncbi:thiolase family protein [Sandaracinus amylolyticus]|uniref:3-ketoacyl-CoA thiolase n=1 Tax=Sandaracinus amylolyticus TaxID=927083 RepID=A0A0F6W0W8_9BACT|nr:acetyl-CoA C-acyltransferase [Sandaracinus amylolyticus]AKF04415.1 3-ketoacyl-CoA thiolase [Sandaracinus amylolyticus]
MKNKTIFLAAGLRTPFTRVDGGLAGRDAITMSAPVMQAMAAKVRGRIDVAAWGTVIPNLGWSNLAREAWLEAKLDPTVPTFSVVMQCSTSMVAAFNVAGVVAHGGAELGMAGGVESMSHVQMGLTPRLSDSFRKIARARSWKARSAAIGEVKPRDVRIQVQAIANRATGKSMGQHSDETAYEWKIARADQDALALEGHRRAVAAQKRGFFDDLIVSVDGVSKDAFPRAETSLEALAKLPPAFDRERGTATAGNSSPLTDGAAGVWVASEEGLARLPASTPRARLVDYELAAIDLYSEGLLMAPAYAIPRLLARNGLRYDDIALWEIHEAFSAQILYQLAALDSPAFLKEKARVEADLGKVPRDRLNPNGGSVALGHPFGATGARILSQALKELSKLPRGSKAIVSICADGGVGSVALLEV